MLIQSQGMHTNLIRRIDSLDSVKKVKVEIRISKIVLAVRSSCVLNLHREVQHFHCGFFDFLRDIY